jgi:periplasmic protein TonB
MNAPFAEQERRHRRTAMLVLEVPEDAPKPPELAQHTGEYKKHSLAAQYWGDLSQSERPMRQLGRAEAQALFLQGMLDTPTDHRRTNQTDWIISLALHILIVTAILIAPLAFTEGIDLRAFQLTHLTVPKPPAALPPPPAAVAETLKRAIRPVLSAWVAPSVIPRRIEIIKDPPAPNVDPQGVIGGIPGGETGGVLGGILGGVQHGPAAPAAAPPAPKKTVYAVGGEVKPPRQLTVVQPSYPPIARTAHMEGVVVIDAIIDDHGDVVEARAVSGPGLLMPAALKAVIQWKYEPTYLDGVPVAIRMEVQVDFRLQ